MKIHKEGYVTIIIVSFIILLLLYCTLFLFNGLNIYLRYGIGIMLLFLLCIQIRFFRVPSRVVNAVKKGILSSADGLVVDVSQVVEDEYFHDQRICISIFMSIWNVHVNCFPIDGKVVYKKYHPGKHLLAFLPKSSKDNEHFSVVVRNDDGEEILIRQIAGFLARRIVSNPEVGQKVSQGDEIGIIKFGSRVDMFLPLNVQTNVSVDNPVRSAKSLVAYFE